MSATGKWLKGLFLTAIKEQIDWTRFPELVNVADIEVTSIPNSSSELQIKVKTHTLGNLYFTVKVSEHY